MKERLRKILPDSPLQGPSWSLNLWPLIGLVSMALPWALTILVLFLLLHILANVPFMVRY